ncbi:ABC transporter permease [Azospirillum argentinense]|uniref:ABC transmembrane type-1 domain-containing protein n=1 Tax=Azospirillum argentinense TaxID=2970906 RepID=A0A5B0KT71_9PROT|nr:ABC transporter permease [Azospirillum argentinense]KAA1055096.1 Osmoprotectant ABC transporter inner membrane protein YehW [Azospirillum argentinense]
MSRLRSLLTDRLALGLVVLAALVLGMPALKPLFAAAFPALDRPLYEADGFLALTLDHLALAGGASLLAVLLGGAAGIAVTRPFGREFRGILDAVAAMGQTFPPVAVLAVSVPVLGFGPAPALIALTLYGLLPIVENTVAGLESVPEPVREAARGMGMGPGALLWRVELPLAAPVILAGVRTAAVVNLGTAAIASTVGAKTLGLPIIVGLNGSNPAYVIQGAVIVAALAVVLDAGFDRLAARLTRWRPNAV